MNDLVKEAVRKNKPGPNENVEQRVQLRELDDMISKLTIQRDAALKEHDDPDVKPIMNRINELKEENAKMNSEITRLSGAAEVDRTLREEIKFIKSQLDETEEQLASRSEAVEKAKAELEEKTVTVQNLKLQIESARRAKANLETMLPPGESRLLGIPEEDNIEIPSDPTADDDKIDANRTNRGLLERKISELGDNRLPPGRLGTVVYPGDEPNNERQETPIRSSESLG
eukprot:GHVL01044508.1.p2 GENE.GHVL01044508.1~~GHVL01044508.1.p2  ORF type:complete len:229 (+),score=52.52 GHVL01044508.1:1189-1875(+)